MHQKLCVRILWVGFVFEIWALLSLATILVTRMYSCRHNCWEFECNCLPKIMQRRVPKGCYDFCWIYLKFCCCVFDFAFGFLVFVFVHVFFMVMILHLALRELVMVKYLVQWPQEFCFLWWPKFFFFWCFFGCFFWFSLCVESCCWNWDQLLSLSSKKHTQNVFCSLLQLKEFFLARHASFVYKKK